MALLTRSGDQRWETHDGRFYLYGEYAGGHGRVRYSIGERTQEGDQHIEDVFGLRQARARLKEILEGGAN
jgi:hypothetical protein